MRKVIGFVTGGLKFNGNSINETALGGSESAMVYMARELAKLGNEVYVFCECDKPGIYDGVVYDSNIRFKDHQYPQLDVCIVSRYLEFFQQPLDSNLNIYWVHDIPHTKLHNQLWQTDAIFCMSEYQKSLYAQEKYIDELMHVTKNGFDSELAKTVTIRPFDKKKHHYIYASRPERGLELLLSKIWPKIIEKDPLAQLHLCGYDNTLKQVEELRPLYNEILRLKEESDNIIDHGFLTKKEYYTLLGKCGFMLYPTDFPEISCINAIEAQALECLVISSDKYAVSETVKTDTLVKADYGSDEYVDEFVSLVSKFQTYSDYQVEVNIGKKEIQEYAWSSLANDWNARFDLMFVQRMDKHRFQVINNLVYKSDVYAAWKLTGDPDYREILDLAAKNNRKYDIPAEGGDINRNWEYNVRISAMVDLLKKYADSTKKNTVLDLGCYAGLVSTGILQGVGHCIDKYYAYDASKQALDLFKAHRHDDRITYINDDILNLKDHNLKADIIVCGEILEHIEDTVAFLDSLMEVANPNAIFLFTTPYGPWESLTVRKDPDKRKEKYNHVHHFDFNDILHIFQDVNDTFFITRPYDMKFTPRGDKLDNWVFGFRFTKKPKFNAINYEEKAIRTRPYSSIAVCMIVKNEELNLARCLKSVRGLADEIIVVDTGSTDRTKEIAKEYGCKIYDYEWNDSFEDARNFSISQTNCDWILYIDADEELYDSTILGKLVETDFYDAVVIEQRQISVTGNASGDNQNPTRLFRNNGKIKFFGLIHELPGYNENALIEKSLNQREAFIAHYGYMDKTAILSDKLDRNFKSLLKDMEKYPNRWFGKTYYIRDMYFMLIRDFTSRRKVNPEYIDNMLSTWDKEFRGVKKDDNQWNFAKTFAFHFIQSLYEDMAKNNIGIDGRLPVKRTINFKLAPSTELWFRDDKEYQEFLLETKESIEEDALEVVPILSVKFIEEKKESVVPCDGCTACCRTMDAYLQGDEALSGKYVMEFMPKNLVRNLADRTLPENAGIFRLARTNDGACFYLRNNACSIYETRPQVCRQFDCRTHKNVISDEVTEVLKTKFSINT